MAKYVCTVCGYEYDEDAEGTKWEDLADDWVCPMCSAPRSEFDIKKQEQKE